MKDWSTINLLKTKDYSAEKNDLNHPRRKRENAGAERAADARTEGRAPSLRRRPRESTGKIKKPLRKSGETLFNPLISNAFFVSIDCE